MALFARIGRKKKAKKELFTLETETNTDGACGGGGGLRGGLGGPRLDLSPYTYQTLRRCPPDMDINGIHGLGILRIFMADGSFRFVHRG